MERSTLIRAVGADWRRLRRRWDVWLLSGLCIAAVAVLYFGQYLAAIEQMGIGAAGSWGPVPTGGEPPPREFLSAMLALRGPFAFPQSLLTSLQFAWLVGPVAAYAAIATIGADFGWGTVRTNILATGSRSAFLLARLLLVSMLVVALLGAIALVAVVEQLVLALTGERFPTVELSVATLIGVVAIDLLAAVGWAVLGTVCTVIARSLTGGFVLTLGFLAIDSAASTASWPVPVGPLRELTFLGSVGSTLDQIVPRASLTVFDYDLQQLVVAPHQPELITHFVAAPILAMVALAWVLAGLTIAVRRFGRMDVLE